ncbi:hypothetical protein ACWCRD_03090 [Streptomyces sp. NPDC002092]
MSSTNRQTRYDYTVTITQNETGAQSNGGFTLWAESGIDDTTALAILTALRGVAMPAGTVAQFAVQKTDVDQINYTTDTASTPPSFT